MRPAQAKQSVPVHSHRRSSDGHTIEPFARVRSGGFRLGRRSVCVNREEDEENVKMNVRDGIAQPPQVFFCNKSQATLPKDPLCSYSSSCRGWDDASSV